MNLDEQREASMADEGGASGAAMEAQERSVGEDFLDGSRISDAIVVGAAFVLGALAALTFAAVWRGGD